MNLLEVKQLRKKQFTWPQVAQHFGISYVDMKVYAVKHGLAKRLPPTEKPPVPAPRCSKAQAVAMGNRLGIQYKTVLSRVYALPDMTLEEVEADIKGRQKR